MSIAIVGAIISTVIAVVFAFASFRLNNERKEEKKKANELEEKLQKEKEKVAANEEKKQEQIELKESIDTGNGRTDVDNSIDILHQLATSNRAGRKS